MIHIYFYHIYNLIYILIFPHNIFIQGIIIYPKVALIELKEKDKIKEYLEFDDNILKDNEQNYYD